MSKWGQGVVTNKGMDLIARSQLGEKITFTRIKVGDGELGAMDPMTLNDLVSVVTAKAVTDARQLAFGSFRVRATFAPGDMPRDFWWHEVGVFARGEDNVEVLYLHNAASQTSFIPKDGLDVLTVQLPVYIGNAQNVTALVDASAAYILRPELLEEIKKVGGAGSGMDADTVDGKHAADLAAAAHNHAAADITGGVFSIPQGGTGLSAAPSMLVNLSSWEAASPLQASPRPGVTGKLEAPNISLQNVRSAMNLGDDISGAVPIKSGGTGATTAANARANLELGPPAIYQTLIGLRWGGLGIRTGRVVIAAGSLVAGQVKDYSFAWDTDGLVRPTQTYAFAIGSANIPYMHTTVNLASFSQTGGVVTVHNISGGGNAAFTVTILALARELG